MSVGLSVPWVVIGVTDVIGGNCELEGAGRCRVNVITSLTSQIYQSSSHPCYLMEKYSVTTHYRNI